MKTPALRRDETGAALILALIFVVALGLIIEVLTNLAGTNLLDATQLQGQRGVEYASTGAVDAEIQSIRYSPGANGGANGGPSMQQCQSFPTSGGLTVAEDTTSMTVVVGCQGYPASQTITASTTSGVTTLTGPANTFSAADVGQIVSAFGLPAGTSITSVQSGTSATMSQAATATQSNISVAVLTPAFQRLVLLEACLDTTVNSTVQSSFNTIDNLCPSGRPTVEAVVRFFDLKSDGITFQRGTGDIVQSWVVRTANG